MKKISTVFGMALAWTLVALILAGSYYLIVYILDVFATLDPQVKTLAAIASVVAVFCALAIAGGLKKLGSKDAASGGTTQLYKKILAFWVEQLTHRKSGSGGQLDPAVCAGLEQQLALHGSPEVIRLYLQLRGAVRQADVGEDEAAGLLHKLVQAMRGDLGRGEPNLRESECLELLLGSQWRSPESRSAIAGDELPDSSPAA